MVDVRQRHADVKDDVFFRKTWARWIDRVCVMHVWMTLIGWSLPMYQTLFWPVGMGPLMLHNYVGHEVREVPVAVTALAEGTEPQVDCISDELLSESELVKIIDVSRDIGCSPEAVLVMLPSQLVVDESPDEVLAGWQMECDDLGISLDAQLRADAGPMMFEDSAFELMSLPVGTSMETQVDVRWEPTSVVVPSSDATDVTQDDQLRTEVCPMKYEDSASEPMPLPVGTITETFLLTKSEVFSLAVLVGGGRCCGSPPGRGRDSHSASVCPTGCWERTSNQF